MPRRHRCRTPALPWSSRRLPNTRAAVAIHPRLFGASSSCNPTGRFRRATLRRARRDHDLAKQLLALLQPDGNSLVAEVFVAPPVARRRSRLPARRFALSTSTSPRPHG